MKKLFDLGNRYAKQSDWKDFALLKFCLCALGILIGTFIPQDGICIVRIVAVAVFAVTYIILMKKVFKVLKDMKKD